jgi:hypothetical protein
MRALAPIINHTIEEVYQSAAPALQAALRSHNSFQVPEASKLASDNLNSVFCHGWFHSVRSFPHLFVLLLQLT